MPSPHEATDPSRRRFRELDDAHTGFVAIDRDWRYSYVNASAAALLHSDAASLVGRVIWELFPALADSEFGRALRRTMDTGVLTSVDAEFAPLAESYAILVVPLADGIGVHVADAGERARITTALVESTRRLARAESIARLGNWTWDVPTGHVEWSDGVYALLGLNRDYTPAYTRLSDFVHEDDLAANEAALARALADGTDYAIVLRMRHADGRIIVTEVLGEVIVDAAGVPVRMFGTVQDVTAEQEAEAERRRLELQMQHAQKLESLGVLAGGIAHDFNNLLVGMLGNASLALMDVPPGLPARRAIEDIERAAQRAAELTRQLLAYSGKGRFVIEPVDLSRLVEDMTSLLRAALSKKAELSLDLRRALPSVEADATQLRQVVMNLLVNASDAIGDEPGTIAIRTGVQRVDALYRATLLDGAQLLDGDHVFVDVADTGTGMDEATLARIFDPFFTTKFTGRGLGLAATLGIVRGHKGAIKVYSEPGRGSTFRVLLPAGAGAPVSDADRPAFEGWQGEGTVLVVDDEPAVRAVTRSLLERRGFRVVEAADGEEGVQRFLAAPDAFRLVLLDLTMPKLDGEETFRRMRQLAPGVKVLLMSGYNQQNVTSQFVGKGLAGFLQKPFRAAELYAAVARVLVPHG
jgi:PAS domain S-box-containing protein